MEAMEIKDAIERDAKELLSEFYYPTSHVRDVIDSAWDAKESLRAILSRHPNWDEKQQAIVFNANFDTFVDSGHVDTFCRWVLDRMYELTYENPDGVILHYMDLSVRELHKAQDFVLKYDPSAMFFSHGRWIRSERHERYLKFIDFFLSNPFDSSVVTQELVDAIRKIGDESIVPVVGQKTSRAVMKICKSLGLTEIKEMKTIRRNGEDVQKDYGWNYYFAMFGDAINPIHITRYTVISINPLDYWTMSFGTDWASCQTIDLENLRDMDQTHEGMYSSGTESYMLDGSTVIMYTVSPGYEGAMWRADKERRMNFHVAPDGKAMVFGRLYPDGRDGGETGLAAQFRKTLQKVLSECTEETNLWTTKKGGDSVTSEFVENCGTNYNDYFCYQDTGISYLKETTMPRIRIGRNPTCPGCGRTHDRKDNITCERCNGGHSYNAKICERCGCSFDSEEEGYYCEDNGNWYCCGTCAEEYGLVWANDEEYHDEDNCCFDNYDGIYYFINWESGISPDGEHWYYTEEHAEADGWVEYDGDWYAQNDMTTDDYTGEMIPKEYAFSPDEVHYYLDEDNARADGWSETEDGWEMVA